jgi:transposase
LDHLGLIAGMVDELGLESLTDTLIDQDQKQRHVSVGKCLKAMILNGLGFANRTLYLMPHFFKDKPIERLLGENIKAEHLNDDTLGRAMDSIHAYGTSNLYTQLAAQAVKRLGLSCTVGHLDSSSFHVDGDYNSREHAEDIEDGVIHITQGYSRDHRPDLNQIVLQVICENQAGIPVWMKALDGNSNDAKDFRQTIKAHASQLKASVGMSMIVAVMGMCGGMTMSAIKRDRGVTDYGSLVLGHAGVLDRIDTLCFAAPVFYHLMRFFFSP